ncbi:PRTRC system ParB family protein [Aquabacterium sp.]|uniref:PRTRC system ParB family protein n=1 Tax=Aquabacterium sp. TaxID=1872578 RepID=UPI004038135F
MASKHTTLRLRKIVQGKNPREYFDPVEMAELEAGLKAAGGVIQPIIVRLIPGTDQYEIVAGERRWRAAWNVFGGDYDMPVVICELTDTQAEALAVIENYYRANPSPAEEALVAKRHVMRHKGDKVEAAASLGWKPEFLERRLALLTCTPTVLNALTRRLIQVGHAELLAGVPPDKQDSVLAGVIEHKVTVAVLKTQLGRFARKLADAIFDTSPCVQCQHNSARQSGLFDESLGEGFCQHPSHYDELTLAAVQAKADGLKDHYPVVRIVKASDGFSPLVVAEGGALGVGADQYRACQGCASFGCTVSALPGSQGDVATSLCFDAECNSQKVAAWVKAQRKASQASEAGKSAGTGGKGNKSEPAPVSTSAGRAKAVTKATNQTPQRVQDHRVAQWRKWLARDLMVQPERNKRVLVALARSDQTGNVKTIEFGQAVRKVAGEAAMLSRDFKSVLAELETVDMDKVERLVLAVAASAAFGLRPTDLVALLNHMGLDERRHFKWDKTFLELFTLSELDALADEVGLRAAMGASYKLARARKKGEFIDALLKVQGFTYEGLVPAVMCYPRPTQTVNESSQADAAPEQVASDGVQGSADAQPAHEDEPALAS